METIFYDYKRKSYEVIDAVGQNDWQVYLLQSGAEGKYYIFNTANAELKNSAKPLRSVFNRYGATEMYDIPKYAQELRNEDLLIYEQQKYDVLAYDVQKRQGIETDERIAHARQNGWEELNIDTAESMLEGDVLNIIVDGKQFTVKPRTSELDFKTMSEAETRSYISAWITAYNKTIGDLSNAQTCAEGGVLAARQVARWVSENKANSAFMTEKLVENLDVCNKYDGYQGDRAFAMVQVIIDYMSKNEMPYASDAKLMGDCNGLSYDIYDVIRRHHIYSEECRAEEILTDVEIKTLHFLDEKGVLPLNAATPDNKDYTDTVEIPNNDNIALCAKKYLNKTIGAESYDIIVGANNPYFDAGKRIIGCCSQQALDTILGKPPAHKTIKVTQADEQAADTQSTPGKGNQWQM